ncbi:Transcription initiation factor IIB [Pleurostoma richardsiae]|uniref:Transcription initiation factor IIB n=1 Tax=Pleurostoma richardsiae TaxID=41990 RepID=A0AA38R7R6_9PEZI|nr:Transcription initiation factor IIB [Pleurostoma richardsiae]
MMPAMMDGEKPAGEFKENLNNILMCPDCKEYPPNLVEEFSSGDMVCGSCGLVVGDRIIDTRSEWRTFANDDQNNDDPSRVGDAGNPLFDDAVGNLQTSIGREGSNAYQLARAQNKAVDKGSKSLQDGFKQIRQYTDRLEVGGGALQTAQHIYKLVDDAKFLKGKPQEAVLAGILFISCRQAGVPRTFREIYNLTHVSKKEIGRVFKQLETFLSKVQQSGQSGYVNNVTGFQAKGSTSAVELCNRYISLLGFHKQTAIEKVSKGLAEKTGSVSDLAGRSPLSVAAACIYMASYLMGEPKSSKEIAAVAGVSDGTIKTAYRFLYQARDRLIDPAWLGAGGGKLDDLPSN